MKSTYPLTYLIASDNTDALENDLKQYGLNYKKIIGKYTGLAGVEVTEHGFAVVTDKEILMESLGFKHQQESILKLDAHRNAELLFNDGRTKYIGVFKSTSEADALSSSAYTLDPSTGVYYICERN